MVVADALVSCGQGRSWASVWCIWRAPSRLERRGASQGPRSARPRQRSGRSEGRGAHASSRDQGDASGLRRHGSARHRAAIAPPRSPHIGARMAEASTATGSRLHVRWRAGLVARARHAGLGASPRNAADRRPLRHGNHGQRPRPGLRRARGCSTRSTRHIGPRDHGRAKVLHPSALQREKGRTRLRGRRQRDVAGWSGLSARTGGTVSLRSLSEDVRAQVANDVELLQTGQVPSVAWRFARSPVNGRRDLLVPCRGGFSAMASGQAASGDGEEEHADRMGQHRRGAIWSVTATMWKRFDRVPHEVPNRAPLGVHPRTSVDAARSLCRCILTSTGIGLPPAMARWAPILRGAFGSRRSGHAVQERMRAPSPTTAAAFTRRRHCPRGRARGHDHRTVTGSQVGPCGRRT